MSTTRSRFSKLVTILAVAWGTMVLCGVAQAQGWYIVNGQPASRELAEYLARRGLRFGYYWLQQNGNWGFAGNSDAVANIHGRQPSLSERGRLFSPGELMR